MDHFGFALIKHPVKVYVCPFSSFMATIKLEEPKKKTRRKNVPSQLNLRWQFTLTIYVEWLTDANSIRTELTSEWLCCWVWGFLWDLNIQMRRRCEPVDPVQHQMSPVRIARSECFCNLLFHPIYHWISHVEIINVDVRSTEILKSLRDLIW